MKVGHRSKSNPSLALALLLSLGCLACEKKTTEVKATEESLSALPASPTPAASADYPLQFCTDVDKVKLRTDAKNEMAFFCKSAQPTANFRKFYQNALTQEPGSINLIPILVKHDDETGYSQIQIAWSFHVPISIVDFRNKNLSQALSNPYESASLSQTSRVEKNPDESLDSGLHFASSNFTYDMSIKTSGGLTLNNQRRTQYNLYQVQGGNENLGLGVEHLLDTSNPDYQKALMLNYSLTAPQDKGGTVVVTLLSFSLAHRNFPKTAEDSIRDIANHVAGEMYKALR